MVEPWLLLTLFYAFCHAMVSVLDRQVYRKVSLNSASYTFFRYLFNTAAAAVVVPLVGLSFSPDILIGAATVAMVYLGAGFTYFAALKRGEVSQLIPYRDAITTILSFFLALIFLSETASMVNAIGVIMLASGGYIVWTDGKLALPKLPTALLLIALSGMFFSIYGITAKTALSSANPIILTFLMYAFCTFYSGVINTATNRRALVETGQIIFKNRKITPLIFGATVTAVLGVFALFYALQIGSAVKVLPMIGTLPLFATLIGWLWLKEKNAPVRILGAGLIALGVWLVYV